MLYPGTSLWNKAMKAGVPLNEACKFEWHTGEGSVKFDPSTMKRIKNITKMTTMFVNYQMDERWMRALINMDLNEAASRQLSECVYYENLMFRMGKKFDEKEFDNIMKSINFKYY
jgi:hypothetical protein